MTAKKAIKLVKCDAMSITELDDKFNVCKKQIPAYEQIATLDENVLFSLLNELPTIVPYDENEAAKYIWIYLGKRRIMAEQVTSIYYIYFWLYMNSNEYNDWKLRYVIVRTPTQKLDDPITSINLSPQMQQIARNMLKNMKIIDHDNIFEKYHILEPARPDTKESASDNLENCQTMCEPQGRSVFLYEHPDDFVDKDILEIISTMEEIRYQIWFCPDHMEDHLILNLGRKEWQKEPRPYCLHFLLILNRSGKWTFKIVKQYNKLSGTICRELPISNEVQQCMLEQYCNLKLIGPHDRIETFKTLQNATVLNSVLNNETKQTTGDEEKVMFKLSISDADGNISVFEINNRDDVNSVLYNIVKLTNRVYAMQENAEQVQAGTIFDSVSRVFRENEIISRAKQAVADGFLDK